MASWKALIERFRKICRITINKDRPIVVATETTLQEDVLDDRKKKDIVGDKGGKKDKEKGQKQNTKKKKQKSKSKLDKQAKRKP